MTVLATITIDTTDFELGEILAGYETRRELTQFVPIDSDLGPYFWAEITTWTRLRRTCRLMIVLGSYRTVTARLTGGSLRSSEPRASMAC